MSKSFIFKRKRSNAVNPPRKDCFEKIIEDWYGDNLSQLEKVAYLPKVIDIQTSVKNLFESNTSKSDMKLINLRDKWEEIAGKDIARISQPLKIRNKILMIKVSHSIWKMELENHGKKIILDKVKEFFGDNSCVDIRFVVGG